MQDAFSYIDKEHQSGNRNIKLDDVFNAVNAKSDVREAFGDSLEKQLTYFNGLQKEINSTTKAIDKYNEAQAKAGLTGVKTTTVLDNLKTGIKGVGKVALSAIGDIGTNLAISAAIQGVAYAYDKVSNSQENAIAKGDETIDSYKSIQQEMSQSSSWIQTNGDRFETLSKGVSSLGKNLSLSNEEYAEYQELSSQIANQFPELVTGYDSIGTPIIGAAKSVEQLNTALKNQKVKKYSENLKDAQSVVDKFNAEVNQDKQWWFQESGIQNQLDAINKFEDVAQKVKSVQDYNFLDFSYEDANLHDALKNAGIEMKDYNDMMSEIASKGGLNNLDRDSDAYATWQAIESSKGSLQSQLDASISSLKSYIPAFLQAKEGYQDLLMDSNKSNVENLDTIVNSMASAFSKEDLINLGFTGENAEKQMHAWSESALTALQNDDFRQKLNDVFTIDDDTSEKSFGQWRKEADDALDEAEKRSNELGGAWSREQMRQASGIADKWERLRSLQTAIENKWGKDSSLSARNDLSMDDFETLGGMAIDSSFTGTYQEALKQIQSVQDASRLSLENMQQVVTDTATSYSSLSTAMSETMSSTGMTSDSITAVKTALSSLISENDSFKDANLDGLFRNTADGVEMNSKAVEQLVKQQHDMKVDDFTKSIKAQNKTLQEQKAIIDDNTKSQEEKTAATEKYNQALSDLAGIQQAQSQYNAQYQQIKDMFSDYNKWVSSQSADTAGTPYNNIVTGLEQAYKDFQKGLTGTESFKSFAAMISPTGATDPADFAENYAKASRYLQEGDEGVKNFLNDLKSHDLAEFNQQTGEWTIKAHNAAEAAEALATGTDVASAAFGKMQDYGLHDNTVDDVQDGVLKLGDAYTKLADSKAKLKEMEDNPSEYSETRIQAQRDEVKAYSQDIEDLSDNMQYYIEHQADEYNKQQQTAKEAIKLMDDYKKEVLANPEKFGGADNAMGVANYLEQQMQGYADTYGFDLDNIRQKAAQAAVAYQEALKNATIDNPVKPEFDDSATEEVFDSTVSKIQKGQEEVSGAMETLKGFTSDQVKGIDLFDGVYDSDELKPAEQALDTICQSLGLSKDEASQLGQVLESMGVIKPEVDDSDIEKAGETADTTSEKVQSLKDLQSSGDISSDIELDFDTADMSADELKSKIDELNGLKAEIDAEVNPEAASELDDLIAKTQTDYTIQVAIDEGQTPADLLELAQNDEATFKAKFELDDSGYQEALSYLQEKDVEVKVKTTLEQGTDIASLLNMNDEELSSTLNIDTSQVDSARAELQSIQNGEITVPLTVKLDETQFNTLTQTLSGEPVEIPAEVETPEVPDVSGETVEYPSKVDTPDVPDVSGEEVTFTSTVESPDLPDIQGGIAYYTPQIEDTADGETAEGTINYDKGTVESADGETSEGIINYDKGDVEKADGTVSTGTINYELGTVATPTGMVATGTINYALGTVAKPGKASGTMTSIAHVNGTMHNAPWNYRPLSSAHAKGDVALNQNERALVNEVGVESIVRDGQWSLIPGGAHLENLKKGDIIFSASQTEDLLKRGATPGHARTYAQGTVGNSLSNAFGLGTFKFSQDQPYTNKTSVSSDSSQATSSNTQATKDNTSAKKSNTKSTKDSTETFDWVKVRLEKFSKAVERISNQITDYISSAFKTTLLKRQVKAVEKQINAEQEGYDAYMKKAESIGISQDYKDKVINGTLSVEDIDTSTDAGKKLAKDVKNFQTYYNSAQDCKDTVQELNNKLLELYETIVNMPTEKAEKKIDRLKTKMESLNAVSDTVSLGGSAIDIMKDQIKVDNPGLSNAQKKVDKATKARKTTKSAVTTTKKTLTSATTDVKKTGDALLSASKKQTSSIAKNLKTAAKSSTDKATYNVISQAIRDGKAIDTKGLTGSTLKYAKSYNKSLKQQSTISSKVNSGKTVSTSGMSTVLKSAAKAYNADAKEKTAAQKAYDDAKKADDKALDDLTKAKENKEKVYARSTKEQQILATTKSDKSYVYQNMLLTQETKNLKKQNEARQQALKDTRDSYLKAEKKYDTAKADKKKAQSSLLNNKTVMNSLNATQKAALEAGKTVSTKGISNPTILKKIEEYNAKIKTSADLSKKLKIEEEALTKAQSEAAQSQAEYAQSVVENAQKKLDNIANFYDSFTSKWETKNSILEAYMDRMQTQGYNLSAKFYEAEIANAQQNVEVLSQKYITMKRNFEQAVADGIIKSGTEEFNQMQDEVNQAALGLKQAQNNVVELQAAIRDLKWDQFDQLQTAISRVTSESDFLIELMSHKDMYDKDGKITDQGMATMGLHGVNYNTYMAQADKYKEEMLKISEELANDPNNQKLIDRKNELIDAQQQAILSAENEKDSIKDLIQDGIDKELDALDDLIDKYLDALDKEKD